MRLAISLALLFALPCTAHAQTEAAEPDAREVEAAEPEASEVEAAEPEASEPSPSETEPATETEASPEPRARELASDAQPGEPTADTSEPLTLDPPGIWPPDRPRPPIYEEWWFWTAIGVITLGVTLAIVIGVTTEHPETVRAALSHAEPSPTSGLLLSFE